MPSRKYRERKKARRLTLEIDEEVKQLLRDLSEEYEVSQSQLVQFFILTGDVSQVTRYLEPSAAPMWGYKINFDRLRKDLEG